MFVSSTSEDLAEYRAAARLAILDNGWDPSMQEHMGTRPDADACRNLLEKSDVVLLLVAFRQGWVPTAEQGGNGVDSITALELAHARERNIPVLIMLASDIWPGKLWEKGDQARAWQQQFRAGLNQSAMFFEWEGNPALPVFRAKVREVLLGYKARPREQKPRETHAIGIKSTRKLRTKKPQARSVDAASVVRRIFLCYRRDDSGTIVGRIFDRLAIEFGNENIFKDVDNIPYGVDFVEYLDREIQKCGALFVVIGPRWLRSAPQDASRLDDPNDFVRIEIASALRRTIPVVPVLVDGAQMPRADQLPDEIQSLARRHGTMIRQDPDFHSDVTRLLSRLG